MNKARVPESVPLTIDIDVAKKYHKKRRSGSVDWQAGQIFSDRNRLFELLEKAEREILGPSNDTVEGTATEPDQILPILGEGAITLITAEHATRHMRTEEDGTKKLKDNDSGTGALAVVVGRETNNDVLVAIGKQTGDPNHDTKHPFKDAISEIVAQPEKRAFLSIHGMARAKGADFLDEQDFAIIAGIGDKASPATKALVDELQKIAAGLGLRLGVNQEFLEFSTKNWKPIFDEKGLVRRGVFESPCYTTRGHAQKVAIQAEKDERFAAVQIELSSAIRLTQADLRKAIFPDLESQVIGAALGYHFVKRALGSVALLGG